MSAITPAKAILPERALARRRHRRLQRLDDRVRELHLPAYLYWVLRQASGWRVVVVVGVLLVFVDARVIWVRDLVVIGDVMVDRSVRVEPSSSCHLWAIAVLTVDFLIIYGLLTQSEEFTG